MKFALYKCHGTKLWLFIIKGKTDPFWVMMYLHIFEPEHIKYDFKTQPGNNISSSSFFTLHLCLTITRILQSIWKALYWMRCRIVVKLNLLDNLTLFCNLIWFFISIYKYLGNCAQTRVCVCVCVCVCV